MTVFFKDLFCQLGVKKDWIHKHLLLRMRWVAADISSPCFLALDKHESGSPRHEEDAECDNPHFLFTPSQNPHLFGVRKVLFNQIPQSDDTQQILPPARNHFLTTGTLPHHSGLPLSQMWNRTQLLPVGYCSLTPKDGSQQGCFHPKAIYCYWGIAFLQLAATRDKTEVPLS